VKKGSKQGKAATSTLEEESINILCVSFGMAPKF